MRATSEAATFVPRAVCFRCMRPQSVCLCEHFGGVHISTQLVILQHPRESTVPVNTARLAELAVAGAERHVGLEFSNVPRVRELLENEEAPPILLFPGPDARDLETQPPEGKVTLVVIDGTWWQAKKLLRRNPELSRLPRYSLNPREPSNYRIRREPSRECVSTIEAITQALCILEREPGLAEQLLPGFNALVETQLRYAERGARRHIVKKRGPRPSPLPAWLAARADELVVAYGEANAWPRGTPLGPHPEVVHWAAERLSTGERFEAFIEPRNPMSPSFPHHTGIAIAEVLERAQRFEQVADAWRAFLRPNDVLCGWGFYASEILRQGGVCMPERVDLRCRLRQHARTRLGDVAEAAAFLGEPVTEAWARGRTGVRLAGLTATTRALLRGSPRE